MLVDLDLDAAVRALAHAAHTAQTRWEAPNLLQTVAPASVLVHVPTRHCVLKLKNPGLVGASGESALLYSPVPVRSSDSPAYSGDPLRAYLTRPDLQLRLMRLPAHSPDFNGDEAIWPESVLT
jgi:hypothetical protein